MGSLAGGSMPILVSITAFVSFRSHRLVRVARFSSGRVTSIAPGSAQSLYLVVSDIVAVREQRIARGADVSEVFHPGAPGAHFQSGSRDR